MLVPVLVLVLELFTCMLDISLVEYYGNGGINQGEDHYKCWKDLLLWETIVNVL